MTWHFSLWLIKDWYYILKILFNLTKNVQHLHSNWQAILLCRWHCHWNGLSQPHGANQCQLSPNQVQGMGICQMAWVTNYSWNRKGKHSGTPDLAKCKPFFYDRNSVSEWTAQILKSMNMMRNGQNTITSWTMDNWKKSRDTAVAV